MNSTDFRTPDAAQGKRNLSVWSAYARRDDAEAMGEFLAPLLTHRPELGEEIAAVSQTEWLPFHTEREQKLFIVLVAPTVTACFTVAGVTLDESAAILSTLYGASGAWSEQRVVEAVETVIGARLTVLNQ